MAAACSRLGGCETGNAKLTEGFDLPARWVIHAVGPVWHGGDRGEAEQLASCYRTSLALAGKVGARSIAFPAISTGIFGYPLEAATNIAVNAVRSTLPNLDAPNINTANIDTPNLDNANLDNANIESLHFVCFDDDTRRAYERALARDT